MNYYDPLHRIAKALEKIAEGLVSDASVRRESEIDSILLLEVEGAQLSMGSIRRLNYFAEDARNTKNKLARVQAVLASVLPVETDSDVEATAKIAVQYINELQTLVAKNFNSNRG